MASIAPPVPRTATPASTTARVLPQARAVASPRIEAVDLARGFAIVLMIMSHGINGMLAFEQFTPWGLVPVHAVTKFASSLFLIVFGVALAVAYVPHATSPDWSRRRWSLVLTGLWVMLWYKILTVVELAPTHSNAQVVDALLYRDFPSYVEILGFYAIALLWIPFVLPWWARAPLVLRAASPLLMAGLAFVVHRTVDFEGLAPLQALLVEHPDFYTWGQLSRGPLVLVGLLIGGTLLAARDDARRLRQLAGALAAAGALALGAFFLVAGGDSARELDAIARNAGKHPPETMFMLFSVGGALALLAVAIAGGDLLARVLRPVTLIGGASLQAFVFHIVVIFLLFRGVMGIRDNTTYGHALALTLALVAATAVWVWLLRAIRRRWRARVRA